jgi:hypothetical protein
MENPNNNDMHKSGTRSAEDDFSREFIDELSSNPPPTVHRFQLAIKERMKRYGGGIEGVWKAVAPNLKYEVIDTAGKAKVRPRLKKETFLKEVNRLKDLSPTNEKMSFGMRGNVLLLMNILEILEVKTAADLLENPMQRPNLESMMIEANLNAEAILQKVNKLDNTIKISMKHNPRISRLKVCRDWEQILSRARDIIDIIKIENPAVQGNNTMDFNYLLNNYANRFPKEIQTGIYICTLLNDYKEYFARDILLHFFIDNFNKLPCLNYNTKQKLILLAPLYLLYFFFLCQRRFINIFLSPKKTEDTEQFSPFMHIKYDANGNEIKSERVLNILEGKSLTEYISIQNKDMQNNIKNILSLFEDNAADVKESQYNDFICLMNEIIDFFFGIYVSHVNYEQAIFLDFIEQIKNLNDLAARLSLGKPHVYFFSEDCLNTVIGFKQRTDSLYSRLSRIDK